MHSFKGKRKGNRLHLGGIQRRKGKEEEEEDEEEGKEEEELIFRPWGEKHADSPV